MRIGVPKESTPGERRVALAPDSCRKLVQAGYTVLVEAGAGDGSFLPDAAFAGAGAALVPRPEEAFGAELVLKVQPPTERGDGQAHEADLLRPGAVLIATLLPARNRSVIERLAAGRVTAFSTDRIPRITRAQAMDTLSSMASISGYRSVLIAASLLPRYFPMLMTAAGTVLPARVFVIGAGVAGLQAIATARRLGATVEATDTRPAAREQVESLGARFVGVETDASAQDERGYARELTPEFYRRQAGLIGERCAAADVVITTALIGGIKAPRLITAEMVGAMRPGSVIVDLAAEAGGNCALTVPGTTVVTSGVTVCGPLNLPAEMPEHASMLYARNLTAFVLAFTEGGAFRLDLADEIQRDAVVAHDGKVIGQTS